jgi:hypothetical protein
MDLDDMRTEVRERLGELTADFWTDAEVDRAINEAVRRFCAEEKWSFLLTEWASTLSNGDDELELPSDISLTRVFNLAIDGPTLAEARMLERVDPQEGFRLRHQYDDLTAAPRWYYITRSNQSTDEAPPVTYTAKLIPRTDAEYEVEAQYMAIPTLLTAPSDEPMVPTEYQEAIVAWATGKLWLKELGTSQKSSEQFSLYAKVLDQARNDLRTHSLDETVAWGRSHPMRGYWGALSPYDRIPPTLG